MSPWTEVTSEVTSWLLRLRLRSTVVLLTWTEVTSEVTSWLLRLRLRSTVVLLTWTEQRRRVASGEWPVEVGRWLYVAGGRVSLVSQVMSEVTSVVLSVDVASPLRRRQMARVQTCWSLYDTISAGAYRSLL